MISAKNRNDQVEISFSGATYELMDDICGILVWMLDQMDTKDAATIFAAVYETCLEEPKLMRQWNEAEIQFDSYRRKRWQSELDI